MAVDVAGAVDRQLDDLERFVGQLVGAGPVAGHDQGDVDAGGDEGPVAFAVGRVAAGVVDPHHLHPAVASSYRSAYRAAAADQDSVRAWARSGSGSGGASIAVIMASARAAGSPGGTG